MFTRLVSPANSGPKIGDNGSAPVLVLFLVHSRAAEQDKEDPRRDPEFEDVRVSRPVQQDTRDESFVRFHGRPRHRPTRTLPAVEIVAERSSALIRRA